MFMCDDFKIFVVEYYSFEWMILFVVGGVDYDEIVKIVEEMFGYLFKGFFCLMEVVWFEGGEYCIEKSFE